MVERAGQNIMGKFARVDQIFQKLESEEIAAREKLHLLLKDLTEEVEKIEEKHKKIQAFVNSFKEI